MTTHTSIEHLAFRIVEEGVATQIGPRYLSSAEQIEMARMLLIKDAAIDSITGSLHLLDSGQSSRVKAIAEIRDALDRMHVQAANSQASAEE